MMLHLDPLSGLAGDMFLGACLDLGLDREELVQALSTLPLPPWQLKATTQRRGGMKGTHVALECTPEGDHRHLSEILAMISASSLPPPVKTHAQEMFRILAQAEGIVHGVDPEEVHFHEVGAADAILDLTGAAFAIWRLGVVEISASPPPLGSGSVVCAHGRMPVPVPAVVEMFRRYQVPIQPEDASQGATGELVTPTGAAILVHVVHRFGPSNLTRIDRVGCGLGTRERTDQANLLRILAQDESPPSGATHHDRVALLATNLDDMNPEWLGPLWEMLFQAGALDVALLPLTMKKGRPGVRLEVISPLEEAEKLSELILVHTTSLGVRRMDCQRTLLPRTLKRVETPWGELGVKVAGGLGRVEHDDLERLARRMGWSLPEAAQRIAPYLNVGAFTSPTVGGL